MAYDLKHRTTNTVAKGSHVPLSAKLTPGGVNFAIYLRSSQAYPLIALCRVFFRT